MKKEIIKRLWYDFLSDECSILESEEEKECVAKIASLEKALLNVIPIEEAKQLEIMIDAIYNANALLVEKAFACGIRFSTKYLMEVMEL